MNSMIALAAALSVFASTPVKNADAELPSVQELVDGPFEKLWSSQFYTFNADDVLKDEARQVFAWSLLQKYLGYCEKETGTNNVKFWRGWIKTKDVLSHLTLRQIVADGDKHFLEARAAKRPDFLDPDTCDIMVASLIVEAKR